MKRLVLVFVVLLAVPRFLFSQKSESVPASGERAHSTERKKPATEQESSGRKLLELAEADASALQGGMRAFADLRLAKIYQTTDKKEATEYLETAFSATREIDDDKLSTRGDLQVEILKTLATLDASRTEELLIQIDSGRRAEVLRSLLEHYQENKQLDRAVDVVYRISSESEFPYSAAKSVMAALPKENSAELAQLFSTALASYREHAERKQPRFIGQDLTVLVTAFAKQLSPELVKDAISEILKQADPANHKDGYAMQISLASREGEATFSSDYQFKLFQLLPILRELDEGAAEQLLKKNQEAAGILAKYPKGIPMSAGTRMSVTAGGGQNAAATSAAMSAEVREYSDMQKVVAEAEAHPEQALANVAPLHGNRYQSDALLAIAQATWKKNLSTARSALKQLLEMSPDLVPDQRADMLAHVADLYLKMGAADDSKRAIEKQFDAAAQLLKQDSNADDPNKALKAYWPSTHAYASALRIAGQISPPWAVTLLKDMPDSEIRFCSEIGLAATWLHLPLEPTSVVVATKNAATMSME